MVSMFQSLLETNVWRICGVVHDTKTFAAYSKEMLHDLILHVVHLFIIITVDPSRDVIFT